MKQSAINRTDKHPRLPKPPQLHIILMVWIATLVTGFATSCSVYKSEPEIFDANILLQSLDSSSSPNAVQPTGFDAKPVEPNTTDTDQNAGRDANSYQPENAGSLENTTDLDTDSALSQNNSSVEGDECPDDPNKMTPGACGCGVPDTDEDADGTLDCNDACPQDNTKTEPGLCGCGNEDPSASDVNMIECVKSHLLHRYRFDGTGPAISDSVGSAHGTIHGSNAELASGTLTLGGDEGPDYSNEGYVELPRSIWEGLTAATFEVWVSWRGEGATGSALWQRIFDFGDQVGSEGKSYLFLTPKSTTGVLVGFSIDSINDTDDFLSTEAALPLDVVKHLAVVVDADQSLLYLYIDGVWEGTTPMRAKLDQVNADHCWLGRSNFAVDSEFNGSLHEFRIWNVALSAEHLKASLSAGPDYEFLP